MARGKNAEKQGEIQGDEELRPRPEEKLGTYIRRVRLMRGLSLPDVARALADRPASQRLSHPYLSQIETGQVHQPSRDRLLSLATVLGIPAEWLYEKADLPLQTGVRESTNHGGIADYIATRATELEPQDQTMILRMIETVLNLRKEERKGRKK